MKNGRMVVLLWVALLGVAILMGPVVASAATPTSLVTFTDKKTYMGWWVQPNQNKAGYAYAGIDTHPLEMYVYAIILDENGTIMKGQGAQLTGFVTGYKRLSPGQNSGHHIEYFDPANTTNIFGNQTLTFLDNGSLPGDTAGDGIYVAKVTLNQSNGSILVNDHMVMNVTVSYPSMANKIQQVLVTGWDCMDGNQGGKGHLGGAAPHTATPGKFDNCAVCHHGYEHRFENISKTFSDDQLDIHVFKVNPPDVNSTYQSSRSYIHNRWNWSDDGGLANNPLNTFEQQVPGSRYCAFCHEVLGSTTYDYANGTRNATTNRPSCNNPACHHNATTEIAKTTVRAWQPAAAANDTSTRANYNIAHAEAHAHNSTGQNTTPCVLCHRTTHSLELPNRTSTDYTDITTRCTYCHSSLSKHNNNVSCIICHTNDTHNIQFLQQNLTYSWSKTNEVNCTNCHQNASFARTLNLSPPQIPDPMNHSIDPLSGALWNGTQLGYWNNTSQASACYYCHGLTLHNSSALGNINKIKGTNIENQSLTNSTWCANCHYSKAVNYAGNQFTPQPPEVLNASGLVPAVSNDGTQFYNHSNALSSGFNDATCKNCHNNNLASGATSLNFSHNVNTGSAGGSLDCIGCHTSQQGVYPAINTTLFTQHMNVNTTDGAGVLDNNDCKTCHYNTTGMGPGYKAQPGVNMYICDDCHTTGNYSAPIIQNHRPPRLPASPGGNITTNAYCSDCHNNSINQFAYSVNASVGHYGTTTSLIKPTVNQTPMPRFGFMTQPDASAYNTECTNCHNPSNPNYGNATLITTPHTILGVCKECHVNANASDLHNGSLNLPQTFTCFNCHTTYAANYNAPNITGTQMAGYGTCGACHGGDSATGIVDPATHNTNRIIAGTGNPSTDTVYLDSQTSLSVPAGTQITITSRVNDSQGPASRVGGAEYYIDSDPGLGKGIPLDSTTGQYDAVNGAWQDVTAMIDTSALSQGNHTVYVRGMDIEKQWSAPQSAVLIIQPPNGYINGTVMDSITRAGIAGATVSANTSNTSASTTTNATGFYSLAVTEGTYSLTAKLDPAYYMNSSVTVSAVGNAVVVQDIELVKKPTGTIIGSVTNA